ncbi:class I SAM-dependent methyltransferase [Sulfitobacter sp. D35]|uniref:class I SAM-dependent methyltransferase n=1 Tax=Sulfitobacter sp. D35 TaxID=3083252 RepID=UPI002970067B|nr:class I SAM-dependent methyltransferase [Sulfitobacter sp. D35]MDW4500505.1 class I SAM-dependent methyltransferase [Sulfitobacter sp. D35]
MSDRQTLQVYAEKAEDYAQMAADLDDPRLDAFIADLPEDARVLDLGCGPGREAGRMADAGFRVTAVDAVPEMVEMAARHPGVTAKEMHFADLADVDLYDGVWANFSLLHAPRADMPRHLAAIKRALKPGGRFHLALKTGAGSQRDGLSRLYTYFAEDELRGLLAAAGLTWTGSETGRSAGLSGEMSDRIAVTAHA